jgi:TatD DNase family protein
VAQMEALVALGAYISVPGTVTFKKSEEGREVARRVPLDRLLIETDAPFLTPEPLRGRRNEPAHVALTGEYVAGLRGMSVEALATATAENAARLLRVTL